MIRFFYSLWWDFLNWLDDFREGFDPCPKEQLGYHCQHRVYKSGKLECGVTRNYWAGDE